MVDHALTPQPDYGADETQDPVQRLAEAREALVVAEAALAEEQATLNAFRMQVRLKLGDVLDEVLERHARLQSLLTQQYLRQEARAAGVYFDPADPFRWQDEVPSAGDDLVAEAIASADLPPLETNVPDRAAEKRLFRELARRFHPDLGAGDVERAYRTSIMATINEAYANNDIETLQDLAGERRVGASVAGEQDLSAAQRRVHRRLRACQRRRRKVLRQLQALRNEIGARLWRRAQVVEAAGQNWWEVVAIELAMEADRLKEALEKLQVDTDEEGTDQEAFRK